MAANPAELVNGAECPDRDVVLNLDVSGQGRGVAEDRSTSNVTVVGYMGVGHEQVVISNRRKPSALLCTPMDGDELSEHIAISDLEPGLSASVLEVLWLETHAGVSEYPVALTDPGVTTDLSSGAQLRMLSNRYLRPDNCIGTDSHRGREIGLWIDDGSRMNQVPHDL
jgi:hypothetical protein